MKGLQGFVKTSSFRSSNFREAKHPQYKNEPFWFARNDADMIVLPNKHVEEIRMLPIEVASPKEAHVHNLLGWLTKMDIIMGSDLHFRIIQNKITPMLANLADPMQDELSYSLEHDFPRCEGDDWLTFRPYHSILSIVARISARVFVGVPVCRDNRWLEISTQFTENGIYLDVFAPQRITDFSSSFQITPHPSDATYLDASFRVSTSSNYLEQCSLYQTSPKPPYSHNRALQQNHEEWKSAHFRTYSPFVYGRVGNTGRVESE